MQFTKESKTKPKIKFSKYCFLLVFAVLGISYSFSQKVSSKLTKISDSLIRASPKTYASIDEVLRFVKSDTLFMNFFLNESCRKNYLPGQAYAFNQLGNVYRNCSFYTKAIQFHQLALDVSQTANNLELRIYSLNMLSLDFLKIEAIQSALNKVTAALELAQAVKKPSIEMQRSLGVTLNRLGNIYKTLEEYTIAIEKFEESLKIAIKLDDLMSAAINHIDIAECLEATNQLEEALENYQKFEIYNKEISSDRLSLIAALGVAHIYVKIGRSDEAFEILSLILNKYQDFEDKNINAKIEVNVGWALTHLNRFTEARTHLLKGLELAQNYKLLSQEEQAYVFLSDLAIKQGDYKNALSYNKKAQAIEKRISNDRNKRYVADLISSSENEKKAIQIQILAKENELARQKLRKNENAILVSLLLLALTAVILYVLYRQYQLKSEKKLLTLEQSMLRSQMNPHFLFNSLNAIKLCIIKNETKNAIHYLNKFSKLVRRILEASSLKEIPLNEELETIQLYMNIENIRFSNEINFEVTVEQDLDVNAIKIPSLILQPFLENAIWHGLSSKGGEKNIRVDIKKENDYFIAITITDNGIGRAAAQVNKENKVLKRKSLGINITKERLANFSRDYQNSFQVTMIDLYNEDHNPRGTKVIISIPTI